MLPAATYVRPWKYNNGNLKKLEFDMASKNQDSALNAVDMGSMAPRCVILEQPAQRQMRFRYECEGEFAGSLLGINSTQAHKTFPTIAVEGYRGKATLVVSCVTKDEPYRPHPHKLVGRQGCRKGICTVNIPENTMTVSFYNLGIQCVKKSNVKQVLKIRKELRVDPFMTGFSHGNSPTLLDLNSVRLCFQVFLLDDKGNYKPLPPVVSDPIYDKNCLPDLVIVKVFDTTCPVDGGNKDIILLCEKINKDDIQVRFYEEENAEVVWEGFSEVPPSQVHKQTTIWFRPPKYKTLDVTRSVNMFLQLRRPSDGKTSNSVSFEMIPLRSKRQVENTEFTKNKKAFSNFAISSILSETKQADVNFYNIPPSPFDCNVANLYNHVPNSTLKTPATIQPVQNKELIEIKPDDPVLDDLPSKDLSSMSLSDLNCDGMTDSLERLVKQIH